MVATPHTAPHTHPMQLPCMTTPHQPVACPLLLPCQQQMPSQQLKAVRSMLLHQMGQYWRAAPRGRGAL